MPADPDRAITLVREVLDRLDGETKRVLPLNDTPTFFAHLAARALAAAYLRERLRFGEDTTARHHVEAAISAFAGLIHDVLPDRVHVHLAWHQPDLTT